MGKDREAWTRRRRDRRTTRSKEEASVRKKEKCRKLPASLVLQH